jgi:hypothetical protein
VSSEWLSERVRRHAGPFQALLDISSTVACRCGSWLKLMRLRSRRSAVSRCQDDRRRADTEGSTSAAGGVSQCDGAAHRCAQMTRSTHLEIQPDLCNLRRTRRLTNGSRSAFVRLSHRRRRSPVDVWQQGRMQRAERCEWRERSLPHCALRSQLHLHHWCTRSLAPLLPLRCTTATALAQNDAART